MTLVDSGVLYHRLDEAPHAGMRLGRHLELDARSLEFMVENDLDAMTGTLRNRTWPRHIPILDQGALGSCTGNAGTGALGTDPYFTAVGRDIPLLDEEYAVDLYELATHADGYPGSYPPDDTGSSGLAVCKVLRARGLIGGYRWARTAHGFLRLLQAGPVLQGMPWYRSFFEPNAAGFIDADPHWPSSGLAGGHEVEALEVELDPHDLYSSVITYANSWSASWGDAGFFRMRLRTYEQLHGVDLKQYVLAR